MTSIGVTVAFLSGTALGLVLLGQHPSGIDPIYGYLLLALAVATFLVALIGWGDKRVRWACFFVVAGFLGCGRVLTIHPPTTPHDLAYFNSQPGASRVVITGSIATEPVYGDRWQRVRLSAGTIKIATGATREISGDLLALLPRYPVFDVGEKLLLSGTLTAAPMIEGFDYRAYLARQGIYSYMAYPKATAQGSAEATGLARLLADTRARVRDTLRKGIAEPQAAITVGAITGDRTSIPPDVQEAFQRSGTMHILAISGENISLIVGVLWLFYAKLTKRSRMPVWLFALLGVMLACYTAFTGATPSVVRAAIMGGVLLAAPLVLRRYDPIAALSVTGAIMAIVDPNVLAELGFQLSFAAMLGIILIAPYIYALFKLLHIPAVIAIPLSAGTGAQVMTLPIGALAIGRVSLVSPLATLCADIALLPLMITGIADAVLGQLSPQIAVLLGYTAWPFASWLLWWAQAWGSLPWAAVDLPDVNLGWVCAYFAAVGLAVWMAGKKKRVSGASTKVTLAMAGVALCLWTLFAAMLFFS